jgi:hypothetical protein
VIGSLVLALFATPSVADAAGPAGQDGRKTHVTFRSQQFSHVRVHGSGSDPKGSRSDDATLSEEFSAAVYRISQAYPDLFTTAEWKQVGEGVPSVTLTREPPAAVKLLLSKLPFDTDVRVGANASQTELEQFQAVAINTVAAQLGGNQDVQSVVNSDLSVTITYGEPAILEGAHPDPSETAGGVREIVDEEKALSDVAKLMGVDELPVRIMIQPGGSMSQNRLEKTTVHGGYPLISATDYCTTGFTATRSGHDGVITADHCEDKMAYNGDDTVLAFEKASNSFYNFDKRLYYYYDIQFLKTKGSNDADARFRSKAGTLTTVKSVSDPVKGATIYRYGAKSGQKKYKVYQVDTCHYFRKPKKTYCKIAVADTASSLGGDSGGPWFSGTTAKGTHTGTLEISGAMRNVFTHISAVSGAVGATIKKG